ncbi:stressosome-associated protein Prli42 [Paenibacillus protaetiae]
MRPEKLIRIVSIIIVAAIVVTTLISGIGMLF